MTPFRFGIAAAPSSDAAGWLDTARRVESLGYSSLIVPDTLWTPSVFPAIAAAASVTTALHVAPHVLGAPFRTPGQVAHDSIALDWLSDGRYELGLGIGRPGGEKEAERLGMPWGSGAERRQRVADTIAAVRTAFEMKKRPMPPVVLAGSGPKLFELAAAEADVLTFSLDAQTSEDQLAAKADELRAIAGDRIERIELATNLAVVGDEAPPWITQRMGLDAAELHAMDSYAALSGTPEQMAERLVARRERTGISYITLADLYAESFAPVVELLAGS